jgi:long-subunit fatty acid transport protein
MNSIAAGGVNFPGDPNNPILAPTGPGGQFILGPQAASLSILSITPTVAYQVTDSFAIGVGPMVDVAAVSFDPAYFGPPSALNTGGPRQFPTGSHTRPFWGAGFRVGATQRVTDHVTTGVSYSSPHWFENWEFNARNANGAPLQFGTGFSLPQIISVGAAYDGIENLLLAADVRWMDYGATKLLGDAITDGGAGWRSIWATSVGSNYRLTDALSVQAGYLYNQNPVPSNLALFNTMLPCITTNTLTCGAYYQFNPTIGMSLGYAHGFENSISGSVLQLNRVTTKIDSKYDAIVLGISIRFGSGGTCAPSAYQEGETFDTGAVNSTTPLEDGATPPADGSSIPLPMPREAPADTSGATSSIQSFPE